MNALDELHASLPWWAGWGQLFVWPPVVFLVSLFAAWVAATFALWPLRKLENAHWIERARVAYSARRTLLFTLFLAPILGVFLGTGYRGAISLVPISLKAVLAVAAVITAVLCIVVRTERRIRQSSYSLRDWWRSAIVYLFVLSSGFLPILLIAMLAMPMQFNAWCIIIAICATAAMLAAFLGGSMRVLQLIGYAKPASGRAAEIAAVAAQRANETPRQVFEFTTQSANAFANYLQRWIGFTSGSLAHLSDEELVAVAAHELEHLSMPRGLKILRFVIFFSWFLPLLFLKPIVGTYGLNGMLYFLLGLVCFMLLAGRLQRMFLAREEERADDAGKRHELNEGTYARALEKLYEVNLAPVSLKSPLGHAPLYDRMLASGVTPGYARPAPPSRIRTLLAVFLQLAIYCTVIVGILVGFRYAEPSLGDNAFGHLVWLSFVGGREDDLVLIGELQWEDGKIEEALLYFRAAAEIDAESAWYQIYLADKLASSGRCREAADALHEAELRIERYEHPAFAREWLEDTRAAVNRCWDESPPAED